MRLQYTHRSRVADLGWTIFLPPEGAADFCSKIVIFAQKCHFWPKNTQNAKNDSLKVGPNLVVPKISTKSPEKIFSHNFRTFHEKIKKKIEKKKFFFGGFYRKNVFKFFVSGFTFPSSFLTHPP